MTRSQCFPSIVFLSLMMQAFQAFSQNLINLQEWVSFHHIQCHEDRETSQSKDVSLLTEILKSVLHKHASLSQSPQRAFSARNSALWVKVEHQLQHSPGLPNQSCIFFFMPLVSNTLTYIGNSSREWNFLSFSAPFLWHVADRVRRQMANRNSFQLGCWFREINCS